ncbi:expansin-A23-like [Argentina anserina]|uniref:expansin-A23-like n=1 Tax=Argentina anserina TaxID=57926 RepID=UPI002176502A|nr:expansin-A23-like [Potentilla anserina]
MTGLWFLFLTVLFVLNLGMAAADLQRNRGWQHATATFYGDMNGDETLQGACGYENVINQGYGLQTTALSEVLFNKGRTCGACFQIMCSNSKWCKKGAGAIQVTATNFCPPSHDQQAPWCNAPRKHFDLSMPMFLNIAEYKAGIVPVVYRRIKCQKSGGIKFVFKGNQGWLLVLVYNVGGSGQVVNVKIRGAQTGWIQMERNWGVNWQVVGETVQRLKGQSLSFQVTTRDGKRVWSDNVAPKDWQLGKTYEGRNFQ